MTGNSTGAAARAYNYLYEGILSGKFPLGSPIAELDISEAMKLSRSPVREALKRMEAEGLVSHFPGRGTFVTDITQRDLEEIFELRIMFEMHSLRTAIRYFDEEMLSRLEEAFTQLNEDSDPQKYYDANNLLHRSIIAYGGNTRMEKFYNMLSAQFAIVNRISARDPGHFETSKKKHLNIVWALKRGDLQSAEKFLFQHLNEVRDRTIKEYSEPFSIKKVKSLLAQDIKK